ncbi:MAG: zinc protease [Acidobacteriota bacterium]|nr:zinc protease [Acidobacteriota bacterium]
MRSLRNTGIATALATAAALLALGSQAHAQVNDYHDIKARPLRSFTMPQPKRVVLPNGLVLFLQEDHELPLVRGTAMIRGGSRDVDASKAGLVGIYGQAWRTGGTATKTGDQLDEQLEGRAARLETSGGTDSTSVSMNVLKEDFDTVLPIFIDVLRNPEFRQDKIDLAKTQATTGISRRNDEAGEILGRESSKLGYGANSPYAQQPEYATIASITRDDLLAFHKRFVYPNNIILGFVGDFDSAQMEKKIRAALGTWARGPQAAKPADVIAPAKAGIYFVPKDDVTQANIAMVHPGTTRNSPDYPAIVVMNEMFSGGFSGRLMQHLRTQRGLTYGVGGGIGANWDYPGLFRAQMATKSGTTVESGEALRGEVASLLTTPFTEPELSLAKESILNAHVFSMDSRAKMLQQQMQLEFYGYPADWYQRYPELIGKVTNEDVTRVAKKYVTPDKLAILVVGNEKEFEKPLSSLGTVTPIDITIPEPGAAPSKSGGSSGAAPSAPAGTNPEGMALVNKVRDFVGGKAKIDAVTSLRRTGSTTMTTPNGPMEAQLNSLVRYPDARRDEMSMAMGQVTSVISPDGAFVITPMGTQDLPGSQRDSMVADLKTELLSVLKNADNAAYTFTSTGVENGAAVVEIHAGSASTRWYIDPASGKLLRTVARGRGPQPGDVTTELTAWKNFGGLNLPVSATISRNGEKSGELSLTNVEVNPAVDAKAFVKP